MAAERIASTQINYLKRLVSNSGAAKSRVRARVEHVFGVVKQLWGFDKVR